MSQGALIFAVRETIEQVELGEAFAPRFRYDGLLPAIVIDDATGAVLMLCYVTAEALRLTIETGEAHYWSRSRQALWCKGEPSGLAQHVVSILVEDDQDAVLLRVRLGVPGSWHVGFRSCFYRKLIKGTNRDLRLGFVESEPVFDAARVYVGQPSPTRL